MPIYEPSFAPSFWLRNKHIQTLLGAFYRNTKAIKYQRISCELSCDDFLDIDYLEGISQEAVFFVHGLEGNSQSSYIRVLANHFHKKGFWVFAFHFRSCSGRDNRHIQTYHSGLTIDIHEALQFLNNQFKISKLHIVGFSLGGNTVVKYMADYASDLPKNLGNVLAISVPCDLSKSEKELRKSKIYNHYILSALVRKGLTKVKSSQAWFTAQEMKALKTIEEFDDLFTATSFGYKSAEAYYQSNSCINHMDKINYPTNILLSLDDPFFNAACIPYQQAEKNANIHLHLTKYGGHVGFWTDLKNKGFIKLVEEILNV